MTMLVDDRLERFKELCEGLVADAASGTQGVRSEAIQTEWGRVQARFADAYSTPQRASALARAFRLASLVKNAGSKSAEKALKEIKEALAAEGVTPYIPQELELGDVSKETLESLLRPEPHQRQGYTLSFRAVEGERHGKIINRLSGLRSEMGTYLEPHVEVAVEPFLDGLLAKSRSLFSSLKLNKVDEAVATQVLSSIEEGAKRLGPEERNSARARVLVYMLEGWLRSIGGSVAEGVLDQVREYRHWLDGSPWSGRSSSGFSATLKKIARLVGDIEDGETGDALKAVVSKLKAATKGKDQTAVAAGVAEIFRITSRTEDDEGEGWRESLLDGSATLLREAFGAVFITEESLRSFEWLQDSFDKTFTAEPQVGKPRGTIVSLCSPGVMLNGELVVPPRVLLSRGQVTRFHRILARIEETLEASSSKESTLIKSLALAKAGAYDNSEQELEGREGLELLFDFVSAGFGQLDVEIKTAIRTFLKSTYGAELLYFEPGEVLSGLAEGEIEKSQYPFEIHWVSDNSPAGTILETVRVGLRSPFDTIAAAVRVSKGRDHVDPFFVKLTEIRGATAEAFVSARTRILALMEKVTDDPGQEDLWQGALFAEVIRLRDVLQDSPSVGLTPKDVEVFLENHSFESYPKEGALLSSSEVRKAGERFEIEYRRDSKVGPGGLLEVVRDGWTSGESVVRKARVVVSFGPEPELARIVDRVREVVRRAKDKSEAGEFSFEHATNLDRIYSQKVEPRFGEIDFLVEGEEAWRRELQKPSLEIFTEVELLREDLAEDHESATALDALLDRDLSVFLERQGLQVRPVLGESIDPDSREMDVHAVFDDEVPEGRVVSIQKRSVYRVSASDGDAPNLIRRGQVWLSVGPKPEIVRHLENLVEVTGKRAPCEVVSLVKKVQSEIDVAKLRSPRLFEDLGLEVARTVDSLDAFVHELAGAEDEDGPKIREAVGRFVRFLHEQGLELIPKDPERPLQLEGFSDFFPAEAQVIRYRGGNGEGDEDGWVSGVPRRGVLRSANRAVVWSGRMLAAGELVINGGAPDSMIPLLEGLIPPVPRLEEPIRRALDTIRQQDDRALIAEIEGREPSEEIGREKVRSVLAVVEALQALVSPSSSEGQTAWSHGKKILRELATRFDVTVFPTEDQELESLLSLVEPEDEVQSEFGPGSRGEVSVIRYGTRWGEARTPFSVRVCLGPEPAYLQAMKRHPRLGKFLDQGALASLSEPEQQVAQVLQEFSEPDARPDEIEGFVLTRFARIYSLLQEVSQDVVLAKELLDFCGEHLGAEVFPGVGVGFDAYSNLGVPERNVAVEYDYYVDDYAIDGARVSAFGMKSGSKVYCYPRLVVNRKEKSPLVTLLLDRLIPVLDGRASLGTQEEREALDRVSDRWTRFQLQSREAQSAPEGKKEILALLREVGKVIREGTEVQTPEGLGRIEDVLRDLESRVEQAVS